jgi:hypothetical protein
MKDRTMRKLSKKRTGNDDRHEGDDDGPGGNVDSQDGYVDGQEGEDATPKKKKQKKLTDKSPTTTKPNDGKDGGATTTGGAMYNKYAEDGISVINNGNVTGNKDNESVSKPGFSSLK